MFMLMSLLFSTLFMFLSHPLTLGGTLLIQTIMVSLISGMMFMNFWFSFILFLIMIGGMMIMFMYMTSIASNEKFKTPNKKFILLSTMILLTTLTTFLMMDNYWNPSLQYMILKNTENVDSHLSSLCKFFNWPNYVLSIMLMMYLLITLIAIVKIIDKKMGPLRQK
uniref:NADH-ubiquinone oxidoreductase chain 6 n=1 Tax=Scolytinae sp. BMNH 1043001 TaxID=1903794 RepID=A0A343A590_9CUCU|nr:NADH dehydrogenase subunit 6 [Scolytinae sp. BMNH 1043001]